MVYKLRWSHESLRNLEEILNYLRKKITEREVNKFKGKLSHQLNLIIQNPYIFPASLFNSSLSKQTTIFNKIIDETIYLAYLHINKKDLKRIK